MRFKYSLDEVRERVKDLCLMDDPLMEVFFKDKTCVEILINVILDRDDLRVQSVRTQVSLKSIRHRSVRLDILAFDAQGKGYDIEIQRAYKGASLKRARFYAGIIDSYSLKPGQDFEELNDNYVIFITQNDILGDNLPLYTLDRCIRENGRFVDDGLHILYVNGSRRDVNTRLGKLMHDLFCKKFEDMYDATLAAHMRETKENEEALKEMGDFMESIRQEGIQEGIQEGMQKGIQEGMQKGIQEGMQKGIQEGMLKVAYDVFKLGKMTIEEISNMLGISAIEIQNFAKNQKGN